jgi:hypothetical protein
LYRLLRPEFIKTNAVPLSSDAFSPADRNDPERLIHRQEVNEATARLFNVVIPNFASIMDSSFKRDDQSNFSKMKRLTKTFIDDLHRAGIK